MAPAILSEAVLVSFQLPTMRPVPQMEAASLSAVVLPTLLLPERSRAKAEPTGAKKRSSGGTTAAAMA